ncbi:dimethylaniline monooxygenase [N-oxide-forming] 2 isoform X1 [Prionailurus iriomotensis]
MSETSSIQFLQRSNLQLSIQDEGRSAWWLCNMEETMAKKVAVIGAGVSGLVSLKCCVDEGLEPTCFERTEDIGGLWRFKEFLDTDSSPSSWHSERDTLMQARDFPYASKYLSQKAENVEDGRASIYQSVISNTSKEMSCFSDFPMPEDFPNFLHNSKLLEYFRIFARKFDLLKYIQFQTTVLSVRKHPDFSSSGQWEVVTESNGKKQSAVFDAVMVCSGHHILPHIPLDSFPGIEKFKGQYFHSRQYKHPEGFEGKHILVIGLGNSASDIAVELSKKAAQVFISTRHGSWVMSRISEDGYPWDMVLHTRFISMLRNVLSRFKIIRKWMMEQQMNRWFNHANYGLQPQNNRNMAKRVAIVGAGVSGLASIKCCLEEGLEPTCFERSDDLGGLWRFTGPAAPDVKQRRARWMMSSILKVLLSKQCQSMPRTTRSKECKREHVEEGRASLYRSVVSNSCKEMSCYSDFPFPEDYPNYVPNSQFLEYLKMYANRFNLLKHIQFKTKVCSVTKCPDFTVTGQWEVVTQHEGKQESAIFDAVMVCTGYLTDPYLPLDSFPGINTFKGQYFHSRQYKYPNIFKDKRVLVVGMGNSGTDIAVEASHLAEKVFLSTTGGAWVISRVFDSGYPWDMVFTTRFQNMLTNSLPTPIVNWLLARKMNSWFHHANYGLVPEDRTQLREPVLNDELPGRIIIGKVLIKPSIKEVKENSVIFNNTPKEEPIDIIVFATGYTFAFPFLDESVVKVENGQASLYKYIFPAHLPKPTLAVIGLIKPLGSIIPTGETQARWVVRVLKGINKLPPQSVMIEEVNARKENKPSGFGLCYCKALQEDYITYIDELLTYINAKPNLFSMFLTDPRLGLTIFFGPSTPYQFRLTGPGKWEGARNAILTQWDRTFKVTKTRSVQESPSPFASLLKLLSLLALLMAIFLIFL